MFTCLPPEANPPINEWAWFRGISNRSRLQSVSGKITVNNTQLIVHNSTTEDDGFYSCTVGNGYFSRSSSEGHLWVRNRSGKLVYPQCVNVCLWSVLCMYLLVYTVAPEKCAAQRTLVCVPIGVHVHVCMRVCACVCARVCACACYSAM